MARLEPTRRRAITLIAAACGTGLIGRPVRSAPSLHRWRGTALGAKAELQVYHPEPGEAGRLIALAGGTGGLGAATACLLASEGALAARVMLAER